MSFWKWVKITIGFKEVFFLIYFIFQKKIISKCDVHVHQSLYNQLVFVVIISLCSNVWSKVVSLGLLKPQTLQLNVMKPKKLLGFKFSLILPCYATLHEFLGISNLATLGQNLGVFKVIFQGWIMAYLWVILEQRKFPLGIFEVMDLKGKIWGPLVGNSLESELVG